MANRRPIVVGLSWKKLNTEKGGDGSFENPCCIVDTRHGKVVPLKEKSGNVPGKNIDETKPRKLVRMNSVREAFGTIREKLKIPTKRKKRLANTPRSIFDTPASQRRRSSRRISVDSGVKMYSPFTIDTPSKTPSRIRMGINTPKRHNFSSPGQLQRDVDTVSEGIASLRRNGDSFSSVLSSSSLHSTPRRSPRIAAQQYSQSQSPMISHAIFV